MHTLPFLVTHNIIERIHEPFLVIKIPTRVSPGLEQLLQQGYNEVKQAGTAEDVHHELVVELKQLPEDDVELLGEEDLLDGVREIGTTKRVAEKGGQTLRYEL